MTSDRPPQWNGDPSLTPGTTESGQHQGTAAYDKRTIDVALGWAGAGFRVHPCSEHKRPFLPDWPNLASTDPDAVRAMWADHPYALVAILLDADLMLLDIETVKGHGVDGMVVWTALSAGRTMPDTFTWLTHTGGLNRLFRLGGRPLPKPTGDLGAGVEWRSGTTAHYAIVAGETQRGRYTPIEMHAVALLPDWLREEIEQVAGPATRDVTAVTAEQGVRPVTSQTLAHPPVLDDDPDAPIPVGGRHKVIVELAGHLARLGTVGMRRWEQETALYRRWLACEQPDGNRYEYGEAARALSDFRVKEQAAVGATMMTAADLLAQTLPDLMFVVPEVIPQGLTLLVGAPKGGKSWLLLDLGVAVAAGQRFLDRWEVKDGGVLYLALEDTFRRLQDRLRVLGTDDMDLSRLHLTTAWPRMDQGGDVRLTEYLRTYPDTRLVLVDVLTMVRPVQRSDGTGAYEADYTAVRLLKAVADEFGVAIVVAHHDRKAGDREDWLNTVSGTKGLSGAADAVLMLRRTRGTDDATLLVAGRDVEDGRWSLLFKGGLWSVSETGTALDPEVTSLRQRIHDDLGSHGGRKPFQIADDLHAGPDAVRQALRRMRATGEVTRDHDSTHRLARDTSHP